MNQFDFTGNLGFGQYFPSDSVIHRLIPAVKITTLLLMSSAVLFSPLIPHLPFLFLLFALTGRLARLKIFYLMKGVRPILPFLLIIGIIQILFISRAAASDPLITIWIFPVYPEDLLFTARLFGRFFSLVLLFSLFTAVTRVSEISHGVEALLQPFGLKSGLAHDASLVVTITFRFIPILAQEAEQITKAQAARGGDFGTWKTGFLKKARLYIPLIIPLFIAALERSEILVEAMESRCYEPGKTRTRLDEYTWQRRDRVAFLIVLVLFILLLFGRIYPVF